MAGVGRLLDYGQDLVADLVEHFGEANRSVLGHQLGAVVGGGPEPGGHIDGVGGGQLEVVAVRVQGDGESVEESVFRVLPELEHRGQDSVLPPLDI